jgi:hypothetical protein
MNPPDSKHSMNPNPNPKFYDLGCGFMTGTGNSKSLITLITLMTLVSWLSRATIPTRNRNPRSLWPSMILSRGTIALENPGSGHPDYQVQLDGSDVFGLRNYGCEEPSDSGSRWFSLESPSNPTTVVLATGYNEALGASVLDDFARLHDAPVTMSPRRLWCRSASQSPTLEPLALAIS